MTPRKAEAQQIAGKARRDGYNARVIPRKSKEGKTVGYAVYVRDRA